jgi:hypothetical protein
MFALIYKIYKIGGPKRRISYFKLEPSMLGDSTVSFFGVLGQSNWLIAAKEN